MLAVLLAVVYSVEQMHNVFRFSLAFSSRVQKHVCLLLCCHFSLSLL